MAKALKTVLTPGHYVPKSKGDQDFERRHTVQTNDYRAEIKGKRTGSGDEVWNASKIKVAERKNASDAGKAGSQESVSESADVPSVAANPAHSAWHHMDKFRDHAQDHIDAKSKAERSFRNAENETDEELKGFYKKLGGFYTKAAQHHKDMAQHHAAKFNLAEGTDYSAQELFELGDATLRSYADKAHASAARHIKTGIKARSSAFAHVSNGVKTPSKPKRMAKAEALLKKGHARSYTASKVDNKLRQEEYEGKAYSKQALTHINMKDGKPKAAEDHGKLAVAKALFGKTRARYRGTQTGRGGYVLKDRARGAAIYKEDLELSEASKKKLKSAVKKKYLWKNNKESMRNANSYRKQ